MHPLVSRRVFTSTIRVVLILLVLIAIINCARLGEVFQYGGDEGYELMKAWLYSQGYRLYTSIWTDQPPLLTIILGTLFKWVGTSLVAARLTVLGFALILIFSLFGTARRACGLLSATLTIVFLLQFPGFANLCVSSMAELPAVSFAVASLSCLSYIHDHVDKQTTFDVADSPSPKSSLLCRRFVYARWLLASGAIMGVSLQIKLTGIIFMPACFVQLMIVAKAVKNCCSSQLLQADGSLNRKSNSFIGIATIWLAATMTTFTFVMVMVPEESTFALLRSHFGATDAQSAAQIAHIGIDWEFLTANYELLIPSAAGVIWILATGNPRLLCAATLFCTSVLVHVSHRPYWYYYLLHFAVPSAWLSASILAELCKSLLANFRVRTLCLNSKLVWKSVAFCALASVLAIETPLKLRATWESLTTAKLLKDEPIIANIVKYRDVTHWLYTDRPIYAFHARIPMPPELAVVPRKRRWTKQIDTDEIIRLLRVYRPEQIVVFEDQVLDVAWSDYLSRDYKLVFRDNLASHYLATNVKLKK